MLKIAINKHSANDQITKSRLRDDCFSSHRNQDLFFYLPSFCSDGKANLSKAWSTIGNISPDDKFDPNEKKAAIMCVLNYELLEKIIKKIEKLIIIENLAENHDVLVLQAYFSNKLQDSACSYLRKISWTSVSKKIISCVQFLYIPLKLNVFERIINSYKIDSSRESFLDFGKNI